MDFPAASTAISLPWHRPDQPAGPQENASEVPGDHAGYMEQIFTL